VKGNELVWRTLLDAAIQGKKHWENLADLAFYSAVPLSTTHLATKKLSEIGAVKPLRGGGLSVVNPDKVATVLCAWRNLNKDRITSTTTSRVGFASPGEDRMLRSTGWGAKTRLPASLNHLLT